MTNPAILGTLNNLHEIQAQLLESVSETDASHQFHPELGSLNWLFGSGIYLELYWLREILTGDNDLSRRVKHLFQPGALPLNEQCGQLPPKDHLLNWGAEVRDEHLLRLANPGLLPNHELLKNDRLQWFILQEQAKLYETMLLVLNQRSTQITAEDYQVQAPLAPSPPNWKTKELSQGHYRIGARNQPAAYDNELPPQAVPLSSYRIALSPVSNSQFLAFMESAGHTNPDLWTEAGRTWRQQHQTTHPEYWKQDKVGNWYALGINGPADLPPDEPVCGINQYEAQAYAAWTHSLGDDFAGAILQHEYQWEMAARSGVIKDIGRAWEWCSNSFHPYPEFTPFPDENASMADFNVEKMVLRGGGIHTQPVLRRPSMRHRAQAAQRFQLSGLRLVFPPKHKWT
ncbi:MAG: SUMF1/EgtB/PvdO family nonheme iron enzyme [Pseudomonadota bacterium]